jgi:cytidylate kinase
MGHKSSSEHIADAMERVRREWQARLKTATVAGVPVSRGPGPFTVAVSREAGSNGALVAARLGERLGWLVYDRMLLDRIAEEMGLRSSLLAGVDEKRVSWLRECMAAFTSTPTASTSAYVRHLVEMVLSLAARGEYVIVGRGAAQILPPATTLRVRLMAPLGERVAVVQSRLGLSEAEAARWVQATERDRVSFVRDNFHKDPSDPHGYDLVLNTARLSAEESAEVIEETLRRFVAHARTAAAEASPAGLAAGAV